ncbi:hypothetical protein A6046_06495 [[Haemophilus] ducreyi]|uniref:Uncharacterized protein n=2 Tax=Haemophilus ducreyi TaxID=730 RepID=Q7VNE2_HAEDU|nr:YdbH family protein [[Haemophilus] ducreyi]AAP95537.1 hypothetical protein HD_0607 [[Haemophilus] ducreyi 35000HP]AKO30621.1 C4-dicarboxylate ABC transporter [[Haemophilus] ducreyi]AKO32058.1 C4-dicarboxylate ABC transporter [[Haemophilus] ducreyi]AKO33514.1 C4-dicarboxylate ABC transporter [[Haemophilus] ducreyi]AKO34960.1 C4-dicarboxylate ABC transporter [[Haemophilus] ducreyi]
MFKRSLFVIVFFTLFSISSLALLSSVHFTRVINWLLPTGWQLNTVNSINTTLKGASLDQFSLSYQGCPLIAVDKFAIHWHSQRRISIDNATLDYACFAKIPKTASENNTLSLNAMLALLPEGEAELKSLTWLNIPDNIPTRLKAFFSHASYAKVTFFQDNLTAFIQQQALKLDATLTNHHLSAKVHYQPREQEQHNLSFSSTLVDNLFEIPTAFEGHYHWRMPKEIIENDTIREGKTTLRWTTDQQQTRVGEWLFTSVTDPTNQLQFPFTVDQQTLEIKQGKFYLDWLSDFPLQGFINARLTPNSFTQADFYPIKTYLRVSLLSQSKTAGKANIVLQNNAGELHKDSVNLPLQITGNIKYNDMVLYSSLPIDFKGKFDDLTLKFQPKSLLRLVGKERLLTIKELRFPLAGIQINKYGINGRLQALFKGESPDFENIHFHLDGMAQHFKMGQLDFFKDAALDQSAKDQWHWKIWGSTKIKNLADSLKLSGRGNWHKNLVQINELTGSLGNIYQKGIAIPNTELRLLEPIKFAYQKWYLAGRVQIKAPEINFDYGGQLLSPTATLQANGEIENLNLKGEIRADKIGPLKLFARRKLTQQSSTLLGRLYWKEQPANIFQSLFPFRQNWLITAGTIRGETAFSVSAANGLVTGGHFAIRNGAISMPYGEAKGLEFNLPYRLKNNQLDFGLKQPINLKIAYLNVGLPITNIRAKVFGHYPYTPQQPLKLEQLSMNLLDGALRIEHFALPQTKVAYLHLSQINFEQILALLKYQQIELKGRANATFPFWIEGKPCYVCNGSMAQAVSSRLKIAPELMQAISQSNGYSERLLAYLLHDTRITDLTSKVNINSEGEMALQAKLNMQLNQQAQTKINFNYHHQENVFKLWRTLNAGTYVEQNFENSIYQKLDRTNE